MDIKHLSFDNRDEFNRRNIADKVIKLLDAGIDVSPMVIDGSWGTGKTEFCHKLLNLLSTKDTHQQIYIDAFRADHADEPLMTILAEVIKILPSGEAQRSFIEKALPALRYGIKTIAKAGVAHLLRQDYLDVVDDFDKELQETAEKTIDATVESLLKEHVQAEKNLKSLQNALQEIAAIKPIVVFVDELDRCRPNFAIELLEIIKHTFDVPNVRFVLITNKKQLKAAINHCYGASVDAHRYLDKFVKFTISLPEVTAKNTHNESLASIAHYKNLVQASNVLKDLKLSDCPTIRIVETVIKANSLSLREVETFVRHIEIYVTLSEQGYLKPTTIFGVKMLAMVAIALYCINPDLSQAIQQKRFDAKSLGDFLGVSSLSSITGSYPDEMELFCYILCKSAKYNPKLFIPPAEQAEIWKQHSAQCFRGAFYLTDEPITICIKVMQVLILW